MLKFDAAQLRHLERADRARFIEAVAALFLKGRMANSNDGDLVFDRMCAAHEYAESIGISSTPSMVQFMFLAADAPAIFEDPLITRQLEKPGATAQQRLNDLLAVMHWKLGGSR